MAGTQSIGGLISGFDTATIIESLMSIERRPVVNMENKILQLEGKQEGYLSINRMLLEYKSQVDLLGKVSTYSKRTAASSNTSLLSATAFDNAAIGAHTFRVARSAQTHQLRSAGFTDKDSTAIGAGEIHIDGSGASLLHSTKVESLNGDNGIYRGSIHITDRSGEEATINLGTAETITDILEAINNNTDIDVLAQVSADGSAIHLVDQTGSVASNLMVEEVGNGSTAEDLGLLSSVAADEINGTSILYLDGSTALSSLRDGLGIDDGTLGEIQYTLNGGPLLPANTIDFSDANTVQDVIDAIEATGVFTAELTTNALKIDNIAGDFFQFYDEANTGDTTATDLGITGLSALDTLTGSAILGQMNTVLLSNLTGANGGSLAYGGMKITDRAGVETTVNTVSTDTLSDTINKINAQAVIDGAAITATLNDAGDGIVITDTSGGALNLIIENNNSLNPDLATNLGLEVNDAVDSKIGSTAKRSGINLGGITITDRANNVVNIDISAAETLQDVIETINASGANVTAEINNAGNGLLITDTTASGAVVTNLKIEDNGSNSATDLGIALDGTSTKASVDGGDLDRHYISRATLLSELNAGNGVFAGYVEVTDANGGVATGDFSSLKTVGEVIAAFNASGLAIEARINTTGDGIMLINTTGSGTITVGEYNNGTTAQDLGLLGNAANGETLDGSFERVVEVDANDTLTDIVTKIANSGAPIALSIINDGSGIKPYHLSIASLDSGVDGMLVIDTTIDGFSFDEISSAQDALLLYGSSSASPLLLSSSTNTFSNEVPGLSLIVNSADINQTVTVNISHDTEVITTAITNMTDSYNNLNEIVRILTEYDTETSTPGLLFGESTVHSLMRDIDDLLVTTVPGLDGGISQLFDIGIKYEYDSTEQKSFLTVDDAMLSDALTNYFESVRDLMTKSTNMARSSHNSSIFATNSAGATITDITIFDELRLGAPFANEFEDTDNSLWSISGARLGENTDASGNIYLEVTDAGGGLHDISAYSDAAMSVLVASALGVDATTGNPETFTLTEENDSGLTIVASTSGDLVHLDSVTINNLTTELTSIKNLINGNTSSRDFGAVNGYQASEVVDHDEIILNLDQSRPINQIVIHHIDTEDMPAADWAISKFDVEYFNTLSKTWEVAGNYQNNKSGITIITLPSSISTNQIRLTIHDTNAPDKLARLVEIEAYESEGTASKMRTSLSTITDSIDGVFATAKDTLNSKIKDIQNSIENMEKRLEMKEIALIKEWSAMENALAELQSQSSFFSAQMNALNSSRE